ncbi:MAG: NHLP bacteriocin system secretion protein [Rubripirellula sp.]
MIAFRQKALVKQRSPEQLDEPLRVLMPLKTATRTMFVVFVALFLIWAVAGSYPETGRGQGIFVVPNTVVPIQAQADGQIGAWYVSVGEFVEANQVLGTLENAAVQQELDQARAKLEETNSRNEMLGELRKERHALELATIDRKSEVYKSRIKYLSGFIEKASVYAEESSENTLKSLEVQRENLLQAKKAAVEVATATKGRLDSYARLRLERLASIDSVTTAKRQYDDSKVKLRDLDLQLLELDLREVEARESYMDSKNLLEQRGNTLTNLNLQLRTLDNQRAQLAKQNRESEFRDKNQIEELERTVERLEKRLDTESVVQSKYAGRVLELTAPEGGVVTFGQRLVQVETSKAEDDMVVLAYCQDKLGKHLSPGMTVRVSPSTVDQRRFGNIRGEILTVTEFPVTSEAVVNYVGNSEVARTLTRDKHHIELAVELAKDENSPSGYGWTSLRGPDVEITPGTTADVHITYERRSPLSFVLPKLREWTGIEMSPVIGR